MQWGLSFPLNVEPNYRTKPRMESFVRYFAQWTKKKKSIFQERNFTPPTELTHCIQAIQFLFFRLTKKEREHKIHFHWKFYVVCTMWIVNYHEFMKKKFSLSLSFDAVCRFIIKLGYTGINLLHRDSTNNNFSIFSFFSVLSFCLVVFTKYYFYSKWLQ